MLYLAKRLIHELADHISSLEARPLQQSALFYGRRVILSGALNNMISWVLTLFIIVYVVS